MGQAICALLVGAISRDLERSEGGTEERPGGVVHHAGRALLGLGAQVRILTRLNSEDHGLLTPLRVEGASVHALESAQTTTYRNDYSGEVDLHELVAESDPIGPDDLPRDWDRPELTHLGPLHPNDLTPAVADCADGLVGIDLQGLVRQIVDGETRLEPNALLPAFLAGVHVVQVSESELAAVLDGETLDGFVKRYAVAEMIVTRGRRGARIVEGGRHIEVPAHPTQGKHRAGTGDVFLTTYLFSRVRGFEPARAGALAAEICAWRIEHGAVPVGRIGVPE